MRKARVSRYRPQLLVPILLLALALVAAACGSDDSGDSSAGEAPTETATETPESSATAEGTEAAEPTETTATAEPTAEATEIAETTPPPGPDGWPLPNLDPSSTRAVFDSDIDSSTVDQLEVGWSYALDLGTRAASTPIVVGDAVYLGDLNTNVHAIDLETGEGLWKVAGGGPLLGPAGVVVEDGVVFADHKGTGIAAYDAATGDELWVTNLTDHTGGGFVLIQPTVADGKVLAATVALQVPGSRGTLFALDQASGEIVWSFDTIESPDLWGHPEINNGGGTWFAPSFDPETGISYWGTANPWPMPGVEGFPNGSSRPGDNKWTDSLLAIDTATGELIWGNQAIEHDLFDRDTIFTAIADLPDGTRTLIHTGKFGRVRGLDEDGEVLWDTSIGMHQNDEVESFEGPLDVLPGGQGGVTSPVAVADGVVYVGVLNAPILHEAPDDRSGGFDTRFGEFDSQFYAIDAATGDILWEIALPGDSIGGATVVNDLVFTSTMNGQMFAFDRETGEEVWAFELPGPTDGWPAVVGNRLIVPLGGYNQPALVSLELLD